MFQTEKLSNLLEQLQNGQNLGYFRTLSLILQIIGYFIVPVLCIVAFFVAVALIFNRLIPWILARHMMQKYKKLRQNIIEHAKPKNLNKKLLDLETEFKDNCKNICSIVYTLRLIFQTVVVILFTLPFYFTSATVCFYVVGIIDLITVAIFLTDLEENCKNGYNPVADCFWCYFDKSLFDD